MAQSLEVMPLMVYLNKFKFQAEILLSFICFLFSFFAFFFGSIVLDHLNFFKYFTSSMFKDGVSYNCLSRLITLKDFWMIVIYP